MSGLTPLVRNSCDTLLARSRSSFCPSPRRRISRRRYKHSGSQICFWQVDRGLSRGCPEATRGAEVGLASLLGRQRREETRGGEGPFHRGAGEERCQGQLALPELTFASPCWTLRDCNPKKRQCHNLFSGDTGFLQPWGTRAGQYEPTQAR